ncbi:MAG: hypothetical protein P3W96_013690 [Halomonas sp.]|nr:hypothetical protein [Halomonas sp.]MDM7483042.1 hypothetical protein [Halomonas sp.]
MNTSSLTGAVLFIGLATQAAAAPQLYETGPSEDAAFVRFVDALPNPVTVRTGKGGQLVLDPKATDTASTPWQAVKARTPLKATLEYEGQKQEVELAVEPSEFVTIAALPNGKGSWQVRSAREKATDFSARKVALGLLNLDPNCSPASVKVAGKELSILENISPEGIQRRMLNPVDLAVDLYCAGQRVSEGVSLGTLRPGERWTLLIIPEGGKTRLMPILDRLP